MFDDKRSKKVILAAHCILNQNAKIDRCAHYPGAMVEVMQALLEAGIGIVQMPCPELLYLGLDRQVNRGAQPMVESEDTRVGERMNEPRAQAMCRKIAADLIYQIEEYQKNGFEVVGILGINGSPTCGVEIGWSNDQEQPSPGVFIEMLSDALAEKGVPLPMRGIRASEPQASVTVVKALL